MPAASDPKRQAVCDRIEAAGLVAIVRADQPDGVVECCRALVEGGVTCLEITLTTPNALEAISQASRQLGDRATLGVGSVTSAKMVDDAVDAGATFVVAPVFKPEIVERSHHHAAPCVPGGLTPTEILTAHEAGADFIKVFPANHFGPKFFKDVLAPLPYLKLTPTGGVNLDTLPDWFAAGAKCLGVGSALVRKDLIANADWPGLTSLAQRYVEAVKAARG